MDFSEFRSEVKFHKNIVDNKEVGCYQILVWKVLPYVVPIAMQSAIAVDKDMEGNEINNIYNKDAVFTFGNSTSRRIKCHNSFLS